MLTHHDSKGLLTAELIALGLYNEIQWPWLKQSPPKPKSKCGLPGCEILSVKDYCCKEHCLEHRARTNSKR